MDDNELLLIDRLGVIRDTINKYGENNFYISFSGGKDSTIVSRLVDMALPDNKIPRVFINTGIEYNAIVEFVHSKMAEDDRFIEIKPSKPIKQMLEEKGYPFKSKEHSQKLSEYKRGYRHKSLMHYFFGTEGKFVCPSILKYQLETEMDFTISQKCCDELKKKPTRKYEQTSHRQIRITGMRKEEGGERTTLGCIVTKGDKLVKFHPLSVVSEEWENWLIERERETL